MATASLFKTPLKAIWDVRGNPTETLWWPANEAKSSKPKVIFLMIPGNPGLIGWYEEFLQHVHDGCNFGIDIVGVGHLGHSANSSNPGRLYSLREQVEHKVECIDLLRKQYPEGTEFVIAGHSMGSWVAKEILRERPNHNIRKIIALFPTLRHIADTPNGILLTPFFSPFFRSTAGFLVNTLNLLPVAVLKGFVRLVTGQTGPALTVTVTQMLQANVVRNALFLAGEEMETIKDLDYELLETHFDKYVFYYSAVDDWAPIEHHDEMKEKNPKGKILLCEDNLPHAFVLEHSDVMGAKVAGWLNEMYYSDQRLI